MPARIGCILLMVLFVNCCETTTTIPYSPPIVFEGEINGVAVRLPGYLEFPNTCTIHGDSVIMEMFSDDYSPANIPTGIYLRVKVFPQPGDTAFPLYNPFSERNCQVHYVVHSDLATCSYDITPIDTVTGSQTFSMEIVGTFSRSHGAAVNLAEITAVSRSLTSFCQTQTSGIRAGTITGNIQ